MNRRWLQTGRRLVPVLALSAALTAGCAAPARQPAATVPAGTGTGVAAFPADWTYPSTPPAVGRSGMVVTTDTLATRVGLEILQAGGNAVDAAIAVQFALAVTHPQAGNIGGGGFMIVRTADDTRAALDFRERAPAAASRDMYLDEAGVVTDRSWTGPLAAGVPGSVAGMEAAHRRFGTLPWETLLAPAIRLADGFPMTGELHRALEGGGQRLASFKPSADVFLPDGEPVSPGVSFAQPDLARTLRAIASGGAEAFYRGWIADSLVAEMTRGNGLIRHEDLAGYEAIWRDPVVVEYRGREIISMPPPSSGGVTMSQMLQIVEGFDLTEEGWHSADAIHLMVEAMRLAYADRNHYLGDPDHVEMPIQRLTSARHADSLRTTIDPDRASPSAAVGPAPAESSETTHFSIVDGHGNAVAVTTTINGYFGSAVTVRGAGFLLNNEMDDFAAKPGSPNAFGLVQGEANAIQPGKRMLSSMTPTIVVAPDGRTELVTGTPGGSTIITIVFQMVTNQVDFRLPVQASVNAPRFHHQHLPDAIVVERGGLDPAVLAELEARGHEVRIRSRLGDVQSIYVAPDGRMYGASDPRLLGFAAGY